MFVRPGWNHKKYQGILSAANPVPSAALPNIHNDILQAIQGGTINEHYHLTSAEYVYLQWAKIQPKWQEAVMVVCEYVVDENGDQIITGGPVYAA